jgi:hypothetical protein
MLGAAGDFLLGGTLPSAPNITLKADGGAGFAGTVDVGVPLTDGTGIKLNRLGEVIVYRDAAAPANAGMFTAQHGTAITSTLTAEGSLLLGGTLPSAPNVRLAADGTGWFHADKIAISQHGSGSLGIGTAGAEPFHCFTNSWGGGGVTLAVGATAWAPATSESRLKDIQSDPDTDQCWSLIRDIELKRYYYKDQDDKSGVPYMGPMADWLGVQDPELLIDTGRTDEHGPIHTYNQGLLDMKALAALSAALKRIEALEAEVAALKAA